MNSYSPDDDSRVYTLFFLFVEEAGPRKNGREINSVWKLKEKERTDYKTQKNRRTNNDLKSMNLSYAQQAMD